MPMYAVLKRGSFNELLVEWFEKIKRFLIFSLNIIIGSLLNDVLVFLFF